MCVCVCVCKRENDNNNGQKTCISAQRERGEKKNNRNEAVVYFVVVGVALLLLVFGCDRYFIQDTIRVESCGAWVENQVKNQKKGNEMQEQKRKKNGRTKNN